MTSEDVLAGTRTWALEERDVAEPFPLPDSSIDCCVTSPPYWGLRDYRVPGQLGLEKTPDEYIGAMVDVFHEVRRVLKPKGTLWLNMGDSYNAYNANRGRGRGPHKNHQDVMPAADRGLSTARLKNKDMMGMPWRLAFALQDDGWYLRSDIIWSKPNPMPESVLDRPTRAHEYLFLMSKSARYEYHADAIRTTYAAQTKALSFETMNFDLRKKYKQPDGWDTTVGEGRHGSIKKRRSGNKERHIPTEDDGTGIRNNHNGRGVPWEGTGANARSVWEIAAEPYPEAHFATFPTELPRRCILAGTRKDAVVLDPFAGSGTTILVAHRLGRRAIGFDLNAEYIAMAIRRVTEDAPLLHAIEEASRDGGQLELGGADPRGGVGESDREAHG